MGTRTRIAAAMLLLAATMTAGSAAAAQPAPPSIPPLPPAQTGAAKRALDILNSHLKEIQGGNGQAFHVRSVVMEGSASHVRVDRTYQGLPVLGGDMVIHLNSDGSWNGASLTLAEPPTMSITPKLPAAGAEQALKAESDGRAVRGAPKLVIEARTPDNKPRLAWQFLHEGSQQDGTPSRQYVTVDAVTGKVLQREETIQTARG